MQVTDLVAPDSVIAGLRVANKARLLQELARRSAAATGLPQAAIQDALLARESLGSTGVGAGVAIPHARIAGLDRFFALFAQLERAIDYDAVDAKPVDLVCLLLVPAKLKDHLQALASVSRRLREPAVTAALRKAQDPPTLHRILTGASPAG
ncbi:MAG: PTS sugar transporter subunit IIA [Alphaproteobacteria bacterium]|nr:PTS sugar transporter subunit IIA [Alphaproteobacteria bacterium]